MDLSDKLALGGKEDEVGAALCEMRGSMVNSGGENIVMFASINPSFVSMLNEWQLKLPYNLIWFGYSQTHLPFTYGIKFPIPATLRRDHLKNLKEGEGDADFGAFEKSGIESRQYLKWAYDNIATTFPGYAPDEIIGYVLKIDRYCHGVFNFTKPKLCIVWNSFCVFNKIARAIADSKKIPVLYVESGNLPGTINIETYGQMGESKPAVKWGEFGSLPISARDADRAAKVLDYLRKSGFNRNIQKKSRENLSLKLKKGRPTVFYAGQNDIESGIFPYDENSKKYHSPIFSSSYEAMLHLAELAEENGWNFIYKPHPIMVRWNVEKDYVPENAIYVKEGDINEIIDASDVTVTILSTTSYIALIREKPVVMLGYMQLRGQGCAYEAFEKEKIGSEIKNALERGFDRGQKQAFAEHVARMNKYYLFDSGMPREIYYGQSIAKSIGFVGRAINGKAEF